MITIEESHLLEAYRVIRASGSAAVGDKDGDALAMAMAGATLQDMQDMRDNGWGMTPDFGGMRGEERIPWATAVVRLGILEEEERPRHGDAFTWMDSYGYRNSNLLFWSEDDGALPPFTGIDDHGSVPPVFRVGDGFRPDHWVDQVDHNSIVFLADRLVAAIQANIAASAKGAPRVCTVDAEGCTYTVNVQHDGQVRTDFVFAEENGEGLLLQY